MTHCAPSGQGVPTPPIPPCPTCGNLLGLYYAECATCAHHATDYTHADYTAALDGDA